MSDMPDKIFAARVAQDFYKGSWANSINPNHQTEYTRTALVDELIEAAEAKFKLNRNSGGAWISQVNMRYNLAVLAIQGDKE